jgi:hypothetical protein
MAQADLGAAIKNEEVGDFRNRESRRGYSPFNNKKVRQSGEEEFENRNLGLSISEPY